jgi:replicative DNA helicase
MAELLRPQVRHPIVTLGELLDDPRLLTPPETLASGWEPFDRAQPFGAVERGAVLVLAAPPGCYKTATMLRMARGFAENGHAVAWLAGEMQPRTLVRRMLCQRAQLAPGALLSGAMPPDHADRLNAARTWLATLQRRLAFTRAPIGFDSIEQAAEGAAVVFIDYLQLIRHPEPEVRGAERIEDAMSRIAEVAQRTGAAIIVASAQGREGGTDRRDIRNATRGSSAIEYTADALYCAEEPPRASRGFTVEFRCLKQREGERFPIQVPVDGATGGIAEVEE